jgi:hypothetical protein
MLFRVHPGGARQVSEAAGYDEFGMLNQNAAESGLPFSAAPAVVRRSFAVAPQQQLSAIVWGTAEPEPAAGHAVQSDQPLELTRLIQDVGFG